MLIAIFSFLIAFITAAQVIIPLVPANTLMSTDNSFTQKLSLTDFDGRVFEKYSSDIQGTPYFNPAFINAILVLHNRKTIDSVKARIDFNNQEIDLILSNKINSVAGPGMIKEVLFVDSLQHSKIIYKFVSGFPAIDLQNQNNYYQVLAEGKLTFLKSTRKKIVEHKDDISGEITKEFETYDDYYFFSKNEMIKVKRNNAFFTELMSDKKPDIDAYIKDHSINCKSIDKAVSLVSYYNSLP